MTAGIWLLQLNASSSLTLCASVCRAVLWRVLQVWTKALECRLDRGATLLALGGGVIGDMTGFAAACYQRGVHFVQVRGVQGSSSSSSSTLCKCVVCSTAAAAVGSSRCTRYLAGAWTATERTSCCTSAVA